MYQTNHNDSGDIIVHFDSDHVSGISSINSIAVVHPLVLANMKAVSKRSGNNVIKSKFLASSELLRQNKSN